MSENTNPAPENPDGEPVEQEDQTPDEPLGEPGKKALNAEREARKAAEKLAAETAAKLKAFEDAQLSEAERLKRDAEESAKELAKLRAENTRNSVALAKGVPADLIEFLTGDTEEEISERADILMARLNAPKTPKPDPSQGATGSTAKTSTADQFAQFINSQLS